MCACVCVCVARVFVRLCVSETIVCVCVCVCARVRVRVFVCECVHKCVYAFMRVCARVFRASVCVSAFVFGCGAFACVRMHLCACFGVYESGFMIL